MKISIAVPTYECENIGWLFVTELLNSIIKQNFNDYEVIISDQSTNSRIKDICNFYANHMNLKFIDATSIKKSNSANVNNAIKNCSGEYIKIMFMDDFFVNNTALSKIYERMSNTNAMWCVNGCVHCNNIHHLFNRHIPYYNHEIHLGKNTISSPSVLTLREKQYFDDSLSMLMDCEMYKRLYVNYGNPEIIEDLLICNRIHEKQLQNKFRGIPEEELNYCISKFK